MNLTALLSAIAIIESSDAKHPQGNDLARGKRGEVSRYQIMPATWRAYGGGALANARDPAKARAVAMRIAKSFDTENKFVWVQYQVIPISVRSGPERNLVESLFAAFGVNTRRYKETTDILKTVAEWKKANKIGPPGEFIYNPDADPYHKLNLALADNDDGKAVAEIKRLIDTKTKTAADMVKHFNQSAAIPITGSAANDAKFLKTLTEDQKKSFTVAQQYRKQMPILFNKALGKYYEALRNPTP